MTKKGKSTTKKSNFSIWTVLIRSFSVFFKSPFVFIGLGCLNLIPAIIIQLLIPVNPLVSFTSTILTVFVQGAITYGVFETLRGNPARFGKSISTDMARFGSLMLVTILFSVLVYILAAVVWALLFVPLALLMESQPLVAAIIVAILGGIATAQFLRWSLFIPACVTERLGLIDSLQRSSKITKGFLLKIAGVDLLCLLFGYFFVFFVLPLTIFNPMMDLVCTTIIASALLASIDIVLAVTYYSLREAKEGVPVEKLSNSFD